MLVECEACGREVDRDDAVIWETEGETYLFCSRECFESVKEGTPTLATLEESDAGA